MAIIKDVMLFWLDADPERPRQYQGKGRRRWGVQIRTSDKAEATRWTKEFGMKVTPEEEDGKIVYRAKLSRPAYSAEKDSDGQIDDMSEKRKPVNVMLGNGDTLDPNTVGNGSRGDVALDLFVRPGDGEKFRTLKTVCVRHWVKREPFVDEDAMSFSDDVTVVEAEATKDDGGLF